MHRVPNDFVALDLMGIRGDRDASFYFLTIMFLLLKCDMEQQKTILIMIQLQYSSYIMYSCSKRRDKVEGF